MSMLRTGLVALFLAGCASTPANEGVGVTAATLPENSGGEHGHHGEHHGEHHHEMPAPVTAYHDVLAPIWHSEPGATRDDRACAAAATFRERAAGVSSAPTPESAQGREAAWTAATTQLSTSSEALATACAATPRGDVAASLTAVHNAFHGLLEAMGRGHR